MEIDSLLINETQLGSQLNHCVHEKRRSDFSLMLAMLSQDVRDFSEFQREELDSLDKGADKEQSQLRSFFDLPEAQPMSLNSLEDITGFNQGFVLLDEGFDDIRLEQCLKPNALAFRNDAKFIPTVVKSNLSLCQQKRLEHTADKTIAAKPTNNIEHWIKNVKTSMLKSDSISLHSIA